MWGHCHTVDDRVLSAKYSYCMMSFLENDVTCYYTRRMCGDVTCYYTRRMCGDVTCYYTRRMCGDVTLH